MSDYGISYMGSKDGIVASLALNFPKAENFYDLFGGGFSVTHYMLERCANRYKNFHYNEIKTDVVNLVKRAIDGEFNYNVFKPKWVSRSDFFASKDIDAYIRTCWSFGNDQKTYLFGPDIEEYKRSMHQAVVFGEFDDLASKTLCLNKWPIEYKSITQKRLYLRRKIEKYRLTKIPDFLHKFLKESQLQRLQRLEQLQRLERLERLERLQQLQQLQQLEQLQRLERLERLQQLHFSSCDYRDVPIKNKSIVYCDIPYKGMAEYLQAFNYNDFYQWASSRDFPVYFSEYVCDDPRFKLVYSIDKRSLLAADKTMNIKSENLYWNGVSL